MGEPAAHSDEHGELQNQDGETDEQVRPLGLVGVRHFVTKRHSV